jgi:hypothetical protein
MSSKELSEWVAYDQLDHIPDQYWIGAQICQVMAMVMGTGKKKYKVEDFIPRVRPVRIMSGEQGLAMMQMITAMAKAEEARKSQPSAG